MTSLCSPVIGISDQSDAGEKEDGAQYGKYKDALYMFGAFACTHKVHGCYNEAGDTQYGQNNAQDPFFHIFRF